MNMDDNEMDAMILRGVSLHVPAVEPVEPL